MMEKYWKSIALGLVIIVAISIYYVQSAKLTDDFVQFAFKQTEGTAEAANAFKLDGSQQLSMGGGESFKVTQENGTEYLMDQPFLTRLQGYYKSETYEQRKKDHRSFMRDKSDDERSFYEDEHYLAYARIDYGWNGDNATFNIDVLNKDTDERTKLDNPLKQIDEYGYLSITAVTMTDDQLILITESYEYEQTNISKYVVNLETEEISEEALLYTYKENNMNGNTIISYLFNEDHPTDEMMIAEEKMTYNETGDVTESMNDVAIFNLMTNERIEKDIPTDIGLPVGYDDANIYFSEIDDEELTITKYDRVKKKMVKEIPYAIETPPEAAAGADVRYVIQDGKLYIATLYYDWINPQMMVIDLSNMETEYKGEIVTEKRRQMNEANYYFGDMEITEKD